ncbi:MAG: hypothetical protein ACJAUD_000300 [Crocinitomicaceae bacterium]|jgi:hypothetical protein
MGIPEWDEEKMNKAKKDEEKFLEGILGGNNEKHNLMDYVDGHFNGVEVVMLTLRNNNDKKTYIEPHDTQLALRAQVYWINGIKDYLEDGISQSRLVHPERYQEKIIDSISCLVHNELLDRL